MTHGLRVFDALGPNSLPSSLSYVWNWPSKLASEGCVYFLKFCTMHQPEKVETISPSSDTSTHVTLVKVPCCQLSYIPYVFKHCDLLVLKIIILWEAMCIILYSQNPNTTFKLDFESSLMACERLAALNTEWYPVSWWRGGENTP